MPPPDEQEQDFLKRFTRERLRNIRARIEYPLLLTAAGVRRFGAGDFTSKHCEQQIRDEWRRYREGCAEAHQIRAPIDLLEQAYSWADRLATHFAQTYRSGHIFNFLLGGVAVCLGLSAFMAPHLKFEFAALELVITFAIILNAQIGTRHRMASPLARLSPARRAAAADAQPETAWHRRARPAGHGDQPSAEALDRLVRERHLARDGLPHGFARWAARGGLAEAIAEYEVAPQVGYHERHAQQIDMLDHRLGLDRHSCCSARR